MRGEIEAGVSIGRWLFLAAAPISSLVGGCVRNVAKQPTEEEYSILS